MEKNLREDAAPVPELEATLTLKKLRRKLPDYPISVSGFVDKINRRLIHISADNPANPEDHVDLHYRADDGVDKIVKAAAKKINERFV